MTLEELIKKYERKAKENRQLANNLAELQRYRDGKHGCEFCRYAVKTPRNNLETTSQDCISRQEALKYSHIEYDDDGVGHRVIYAEDIEKLPPVTPNTESEE